MVGWLRGFDLGLDDKLITRPDAYCRRCQRCRDRHWRNHEQSHRSLRSWGKVVRYLGSPSENHGLGMRRRNWGPSARWRWGSWSTIARRGWCTVARERIIGNLKEMCREWLRFAKDCCLVVVDTFQHVSTGSIVGEILAIGECQLAVVVVNDLSCLKVLHYDMTISNIVFL